MGGYAQGSPTGILIPWNPPKGARLALALQLLTKGSVALALSNVLLPESA